jgi:hypothetical protein
VEGGLRWALQPKREERSASDGTRSSDIEKGYSNIALDGTRRSSSEMMYTETPPAYSAGDRSPPYTEQEAAMLKSHENQPPPGWRQQLVISTSGLGIAMREDSIRSLRYCLSWLRWANGRLGEAIQNLKTLLERWDEGITPNEQPALMSVAHMTQSHEERRQAALLARINALKADVLQTLKHVVGIVSNYAGGALPQNARDLVHRHLVSLPQRFNIASMAGSEDSDPSLAANSEVVKSGRRVMLLAEEGLDMMTQVSRVVNDTLVSAEGWCEKLGRRPQQQQQQQQGGMVTLSDEKMNDDRDRMRSETIAPSEGGRDQKEDVQMQM